MHLSRSDMDELSGALEEALKKEGFSIKDAQLLVHIWARNKRLRVQICDVDGLLLLLWILHDSTCILTLNGLDWEEGEGRVSTDEAIIVFTMGEDSTVEITAADIGMREYYPDNLDDLEELDRDVLKRLGKVLQQFVEKIEEENSPED